MITAYFENRDFTPYIPRHWDTLEVDKYSMDAVWGCDTAYLEATGSKQQLWEFIEMLRCPVYLSDSVQAERVWWGYIHSVDIYTDGGLMFGVSLDSMANNVKVAHTYQNKRYTVDFAGDSDSIAEYGQKDIELQGAEISTSQATQLRNTRLQELKYPAPIVKTRDSHRVYARIECRGWADTLKWRYYSQNGGVEEYWEITNRGSREIGEDDRPIAAQSFQLSSDAGWTPTAIWLRVAKVGAPTDNLQVDLYSSDLDGDPDASLTGGATTLAGGDINKYFADTEFIIDTPPDLALATTYHIHISRSGAVDTSNYFKVGGNRERGYENGSLLLWSGSSWNPWTMDSELNFRIVGEQETTAQIAACIASAGEFFVGSHILNTSGVYSAQFRDGDATAWYEIKKLMEAGTTNSRRLLSRNNDLRFFEIYEEPVPQSGDYFIDSYSNITDANDNAIPKSACTVAKWVRLKDVIPDSANTSVLASPSPVFIEASEYNAKTGEYRIMSSRSVGPMLSFRTEAG